MNRHSLLRGLVLCAVLCLSSSYAAQAQYAAGSRTFVPSPQALGMGGAAVAYPTARTALFYNPAHLTHVKVTRAPVTMLGLGASISHNLSEQLDFYNNRLEPAILAGIDNLSEDEAQALYDEVFQVGGNPTVLSADLLLPSFVLNQGAYGFGGGLFAHGEAVYNVEDAGAGVPGVDFTALADFMVVASGGADLSTMGLKGFSAGLTAKYAQRYLSLKNKPVDALDDDESLYVLGASSVTTDLGLLYSTRLGPAANRLYLGLVYSDLTLKNFDYQFTAYYVKNEEIQDDHAIAAEVAQAQGRNQIRSTLRLGAAYVVPQLGGPFQETAIAVDYIQYNDPLVEQPLLAHLSIGLQTKLGKVFSLRTGLNQGYTTVGAGFQLSFARIDYAFYGSEQGRLPGQAASWHHRVQVSLGSF